LQPSSGNGESRQIAERFLVRLKTNKQIKKGVVEKLYVLRSVKDIVTEVLPRIHTFCQRIRDRGVVKDTLVQSKT
jgi:hypothetical protein